MRWASACLLLFIAGLASAQQGTWQEQTLTNGITVRYCEDSTRTLLHLGLTLRGGASLDGPGTMGLAHLYEQLFFRYLPDSAPATSGSDQGFLIAHHTALESHFFGMSVAPDLREASLHMLADGLAATDWDDSTLQAARASVAAALQIWENAPENHLGTELRESLWKDAASQKHLMGRYADVLRLTANGILKATAAYRHPGNCFLAATGSTSAADFFASAETILGNWQAANAVATLPKIALPKLDTNLYFTTVNEFATQPMIMMAWPVKVGADAAMTTREAAYFCRWAGLRQGEMHRRLVDGGRANGFNWTWAGGTNPGQILLSVVPVRDSIKPCLQAIQTALAIMTQEGKAGTQADVVDRQQRLEAARRDDQSMPRLIAAGQAWLLSQDTSAAKAPMTLARLKDFCKRYISGRPHVAGLMLSSGVMATVDSKQEFRPVKPVIPANPTIVATLDPKNPDSATIPPKNPDPADTILQPHSADTNPQPKPIRCTDPAILRSYRVYFDAAGANVDPKSQPLLEDLAAMLLANPDKRVFVNSFAEGLGDGVKNYQLSVTRAKFIRNWLHETYGIPVNQLVIRAYGEAFPEMRDENSILNRRIAFDFAPQDAQDNAF